MARSPAYQKYPDHRLTLDESPSALRIRVGNLLLGSTARGLALREANYPVVVYVPREDISMDKLTKSTHTTHCPFKGDASYYDYVGPGEAIERVAWSYEDPFDEMSALAGHLAFYPDRVDLD